MLRTEFGLQVGCHQSFCQFFPHPWVRSLIRNQRLGTSLRMSSTADERRSAPTPASAATVSMRGRWNPIAVRFSCSASFRSGFALRKVSAPAGMVCQGIFRVSRFASVPIDPIIDIRHESAAATVVPTRDFRRSLSVTASSSEEKVMSAPSRRPEIRRRRTRAKKSQNSASASPPPPLPATKSASSQSSIASLLFLRGTRWSRASSCSI